MGQVLRGSATMAEAPTAPRVPESDKGLGPFGLTYRGLPDPCPRE